MISRRLGRERISSALFALLCLLIAVCPITVRPALAAAEPLRHIRLFIENAPARALEFERAGLDVLEGSVTPASVDLIVTAAEGERLREAGYEATLIAVGRPFREIQRERQEVLAVPAGYPDLAEIMDQLAATAAAYPAICQLADLTSAHGVPATFEGRHLYAVKISDNVTQEEDEPAFLMVSDHHAREIVSTVIGLYAIDQLTSRYGADPAITDLVNAYEIWIAPVWNADGYVYVFDHDNYWRKNRRIFSRGTGVDLNRNYPLGWYNPCSGDNDPSSELYKGPAPASESETQTLIAWSREERFSKVLDLHSYGREILSGYACWTYPFDAYFRQEAVALSYAAGYGGGWRAPSADGEHYQWQFGTQGAYAFLLETHVDFQPSYSSALAEAAMVWPGARWMLERPVPLWGYVTDAATGEALTATVSYAGVNFLHGERNASGGPFGRYHAFLPAGTYDVVFEADGYFPQTIPGVVISLGASHRLDVALVSTRTSVAATTDPSHEPGTLVVAQDALARTLRYRLYAPARACLRIYDVRGARVRTLVEGLQSPGEHEMTWTGTDDQGNRLGSGVYFYRLETDGGTASGKLLLLR